MASPNATFTEMVTTTLRNHAKELVDNVSDNNALLTFIKKRGNIKTESGGYEIVKPLEYAENSTYQRYSGYDELSVAASDVLSAAKYDWSQIAIHVTASGRELKMNNGPERLINLVKARVKNAMHTASNNMSVDLYSDGALTNQIQGLAQQITVDGNGTVGGIVAANFTFWKNKFLDFVGTPGITTMQTNMNTIWLDLVRGTDQPDLIISSHDWYAFYEGQLQPLQRYMDASSATTGFETLKYKTASVIFDTNTNFGTTAAKMYFLNTKYLYVVEHTEARWEQDDQKKPVNQDAVVIPLYWMGQLVTTNRALQGLLWN